MPKAIDLGEFGTEATVLSRLRQADPQGSHFYSWTYVNQAGRLETQNRRSYILGEVHGHLDWFARPQTLLYISTETASLDPAGGDLPWHPDQLGPLLLPQIHQDAWMAALLATASTKLLILRTDRSLVFDSLPPEWFDNPPIVPIDALDQLQYEHELREIVVHAQLRAEEWLRCGQIEKYHQVRLRNIRQGESLVEEFSHLRMYALSRLAQATGLAIYACRQPTNVATPAT